MGLVIIQKRSNSGGGGDNDLSGLIDNSITRFIIPDGITQIRNSLCSNSNYLSYVSIPKSVHTIGSNAFSECFYLKDIVLPGGQGAYIAFNEGAFYYIGRYVDDVQFDVNLDYDSTHPSSISNRVFQCSKIRSLSGLFTGFGQYACSQCDLLESIDIFLNKGFFGAYCFYRTSYVSCFNLDKNSIVNGILANVFYDFGNKREDPANHVFIFDFRNSLFMSIGNNVFYSSDTSHRCSYEDIYFPVYLYSIGQNAFCNGEFCNYYFTSDEPSAFASSNNPFAGCIDYNIFVPYNSIMKYKNNWINTSSAYINGWAQENTFERDDILPKSNKEGYSLTWYDDKSLTHEINVVSDPSVELYCVPGNAVDFFNIVDICSYGCEIEITDGTNIYNIGDMVPANTRLTISAVPNTTGWQPYLFNVNGSNFISGSSITLTEPLFVYAIYYDGINMPISNTFGDNDWNIIRCVVRCGLASTFNWSVGDTKTISLSDGYGDIVYRISDMDNNRYQIAHSNQYSKIVLEPINTINYRAEYSVGGVEGNNGGFAFSKMRVITLNDNILPIFPNDVRKNMSNVIVFSGIGGSTSSGINESENKLFLMSETEMYSSAVYSIGTAESPAGQFDYYVSHNTASDRKKRFSDNGSFVYYWLRSPQRGGSSFLAMNPYGYVYTGGSNHYIAPCFAI